MVIKNKSNLIVTNPTEVLEAVQRAMLPFLKTQSCIPTVPGTRHHRFVSPAENPLRTPELLPWRAPELQALPDLLRMATARAFRTRFPQLRKKPIVLQAPPLLEIEQSKNRSIHTSCNQPLSTKLYTAYTSARFDPLTRWREAWLPPCARGARKNNQNAQCLVAACSHASWVACASTIRNLLTCRRTLLVIPC